MCNRSHELRFNKKFVLSEHTIFHSFQRVIDYCGLISIIYLLPIISSQVVRSGAWIL